LGSQEPFDAPMVANSLKQIANHFGIEEANRQLHQLDQKIGNNTNINACADVEQNPGPDKIDSHPAQEKHHLSSQNQVYKINVLCIDTNIDYALCQERKYQLD
jgi:urease beta subunit